MLFYHCPLEVTGLRFFLSFVLKAVGFYIQLTQATISIKDWWIFKSCWVGTNHQRYFLVAALFLFCFVKP